jgi:hypothetical protein
VWAGAADGSLSVCLDAGGAGRLDPAGWRVFKPEGGMKGEQQGMHLAPTCREAA